MGFLFLLLYGFVAGLIARALVPGKDTMGIVPTILLGVIGSLIGGVLAVVLFADRTFAGFEPAGLFGAIIGAVIALLIYRRMKTA
ncbi:MAG TPA: GlsB/YeaQ/YmgE family stress response membrane protein [Acidimicrobiia bacterium]|nr:GlsB/YeaQ/YmgE family stress response membrane protein [Acidimicrobiia bacterium]